ncbi:DUF2892 domain-containing protein [Thiohalophilus sp.]|uniref:YgaP family membrane protein n=1 Tax=Thiohalophilus sp. TaxID=3028392 RepID=UPI002ACE322D|nr:DUF2892 domain-containing protein [Thiohalophilus sp.]MDZ7660809.1 DUF2892 domain-containing protein [Thiohalophilus sp.]
MATRFSPDMGYLDRFLRMIAGLILIYVGFITPQLVGNAMINLLPGLLGILNLASALTAFCPLYSPANIRTR